MCHKFAHPSGGVSASGQEQTDLLTPYCMLCQTYSHPSGGMRASGQEQTDLLTPYCLLCQTYAHPSGCMSSSGQEQTALLTPYCLLCQTYAHPSGGMRASGQEQTALLTPYCLLCQTYAHPSGGMRASGQEQTDLDVYGISFITKAIAALEARGQNLDFVYLLSLLLLQELNNFMLSGTNRMLAVRSLGLEDQGLYRLVGVASKVSKLLSAGLDPHKCTRLGLDDPAEWETKTVTSAVKQYFRNLPEPIMTFNLHNEFIAAASESCAADVRGQRLIAAASVSYAAVVRGQRLYTGYVMWCQRSVV